MTDDRADQNKPSDYPEKKALTQKSDFHNELPIKSTRSTEPLLSLLPLNLRLMIHGFERVEDSVEEMMSERLRCIPEDRLILPSPVVAGPALDALRFVIDEPVLRDLYANLLSTTMDSSTAHQAHPAFVEILRQMTPDEARIVGLFRSRTAFPVVSLSVRDADGKGMVQVLLKHFCLLPYEANCQFSDLAANYIDNLRRLGLIELNPSQLFYEHQYTPLLEHQDFKKWLNRIEAETDAAPIIEKAIVEVTDLGKQFRDACVLSKADHSSRDRNERTHILSFTDY